MNIQRTLIEPIKKMMGKYPIIALTGPRQSGKTTLLKTMFPDYTYISLEKQVTICVVTQGDSEVCGTTLSGPVRKNQRAG